MSRKTEGDGYRRADGHPYPRGMWDIPTLRRGQLRADVSALGGSASWHKTPSCPELSPSERDRARIITTADHSTVTPRTRIAYLDRATAGDALTDPAAAVVHVIRTLGISPGAPRGRRTMAPRRCSSAM